MQKVAQNLFAGDTSWSNGMNTRLIEANKKQYNRVIWIATSALSDVVSGFLWVSSVLSSGSTAKSADIEVLEDEGVALGSLTTFSAAVSRSTAKETAAGRALTVRKEPWAWRIQVLSQKRDPSQLPPPAGTFTRFLE
jgi:hypothetical protein